MPLQDLRMVINMNVFCGFHVWHKSVDGKKTLIWIFFRLKRARFLPTITDLLVKYQPPATVVLLLSQLLQFLQLSKLHLISYLSICYDVPTTCHLCWNIAYYSQVALSWRWQNVLGHYDKYWNCCFVRHSITQSIIHTIAHANSIETSYTNELVSFSIIWFAG